MKPALLLLLLLLGGCATRGNGPDAVCERDSYDDPTVQRMMMMQAGNPYLAQAQRDDLNAARQQAKRACLRRLGQLPSGGGVEAVRRPTSLFQGIF